MSSTNRSNKVMALAFVVALVAVASLSVVAYSATSRYSSGASTPSSPSSSTNSTLVVSGIGTVNVVPDEIVADFGVTNQGTNATQVLAENSMIMNAVITAIENVGVNKSDVRTTQLSLSPTYRYNSFNGTSTLAGYQTTNSIEVKLTGNETNLVGRVVDAAVSSGANQVQRIGYTISSSLQSQVRQEAIQRAISDANSTALSTATAAGLSITGIQSITVLSTSSPTYFNTYAVPATVSTTTPPINPGQTQYTVQVQVTYTVA